MFACPGPEVTLTFREAPSDLLVLPSVLASNVGWNGSFEQFFTWKGAETPAAAPPAPPRVPVIFIGVQLVGLNWKPGRSTTTLTAFSCNGTPELSLPTP